MSQANTIQRSALLLVIGLIAGALVTLKQHLGVRVEAVGAEFVDRRHGLETTYSAEFATFSEQIQDLRGTGDHAATVLKRFEGCPMRDFCSAMEADGHGAV